MPKTITKETDASVKDFVNSIPDLAKREDCRTLVDVFSSATNKEPQMWGAHIVGYGKHHYSLAGDLSTVRATGEVQSGQLELTGKWQDAGDGEPYELWIDLERI